MAKKLIPVILEKDPDKITVSFANYILHHDKKKLDGIEKVMAVSALSESL